MPTKHVTLATAIDKNRISSDVVYLLLLEIDIINPADGSISTTLYLTNNNENYTFNGTAYTAMPFQVEITSDQDSTPTATLTVTDYSSTIIAALAADGWNLDWPARFKVINATSPGTTPELEQEFRLLDATATSSAYAINFTIGAENPLSLRFPLRQQFRNRCAWGYMGGYKGPKCKYAGSLTSCDYTFDGTNGCIAHGNNLNFGGFPGVEHTVT